MSAYRILIVEDDPGMQAALAATLPQEALVAPALSGREARQKLAAREYDLILMDLSLPDEDGLKLCSWIRTQERFNDTPIILVTGRSEVDDKVMAFSLGADEYLVKPVDTREFKARVLSKLQRSKQKSNADSHLICGNLKFNVAAQRLYVVAKGISTLVDTTPLEFKLLLHFAKHEERVFSRDALISSIWGTQIFVLERTVDSHISDLRRKIVSASHTIRAVRGIGYQLVRQRENTGVESISGNVG